MSAWMDRARRLVAGVLREGDPDLVVRLVHNDSAALRRIQRGADLYRVLGEATGGLRRALRSHVGEEGIEQLARLHDEWPVTREHAQEFIGWLRDANHFFIGHHEELLAMKRGTSLSWVLESDHIIEQRIHRMLRDGVRGHTARSVGHAIPGDLQTQVERDLGALFSADKELMNESLAVLVPANEVVAYRLGRLLRQVRDEGSALWYYHHLGLGSKTSLMREFLPWRLEGEYTYQRILDATRWVVSHELGLPRAFQNEAGRTVLDLHSLIREDMIDSIAFAIRDDDLTAEMLLPMLPGRRITNPDSDRVEEALRQMLQLGELPANFADAWTQVAPILGPVDELLEAQRDIDRLREAAADALTSASTGG